MKSIVKFIRFNYLGVIIVILWIFMMGWLFQKHYLKSPFASPLIGSSIFKKQTDEWNGIYYKGNKIGYSHSTVKREGEDYRMEDQSYLEISAQGFPLEISMNTSALTDSNFVLKSFDFDLQSGLVNTKVTGEVIGSDIKLKLKTLGNETEQTIRLPQEPMLPGSLSSVLRGMPISVDTEFKLPVFDPGTMSFNEMKIEVEKEDIIEIEGEKIPVFKLNSEYAGVLLDLWVDNNGEILKQQTSLGWTILRENREKALTEGWEKGPKIDIIAETSVLAMGDPIENPRDLKFLSIYFYLESVEGMDLNGGRQKYRRSVAQPLSVYREDLEKIADIPDIPVKTIETDSYLEPDLFMQSGHPDIIAQAQKIIGDEKNSLEVSRLLLGWVYDNLEKRAVPSLPNALEVLKNKAGDCNEHTVLYVALARAVGLPAKTEVGLVYLNGRFYYHAWPVVYIGEWVTVDPVFNQLPADATHIRLITGGIDKQVNIVRIIGNLKKVTVLGAK